MQNSHLSNCSGLLYAGLQCSRSATGVDNDADEVRVSPADHVVEEDLYRVLVLGGPGVGKTAITQQFLTSEYMAAQNTSFGQHDTFYCRADICRVYIGCLRCFDAIGWAAGRASGL